MNNNVTGIKSPTKREVVCLKTIQVLIKCGKQVSGDNIVSMEFSQK